MIDIVEIHWSNLFPFSLVNRSDMASSNNRTPHCTDLRNVCTTSLTTLRSKKISVYRHTNQNYIKASNLPSTNT